MFLSGDNFNKISNVSIYTRDYYNKYIINNNIQNIIFVNENNSNLLKKIKNNKNIFFTKIELLNYFIDSILPFLKYKFILITHNGDASSGNNEILLNNPLLVKWYGQNMNKISIKTYGIPIGLENKIWKRTNFNLIQKYANKPKTKLLYFNFSLQSNTERKNIMDIILNKGFLKNKQLPWGEYIEDLSNYKFAISPEGNGCDCHRTWECLYLGVIPIIIDNKQMSFFNDLPILYVNSFNSISQEFLLDIYEKKFKNKRFNLEKLNISFWENEILQQLSI